MNISNAGLSHPVIGQSSGLIIYTSMKLGLRN
jgi:hypothetical protein